MNCLRICLATSRLFMAVLIAALIAIPNRNLFADNIRRPIAFEEVELINKAVLDAVSMGDPEPVNELVDWQQLGDSITSGIDAPQELLEAFVYGVRAKFSAIVVLQHSASQGGSFEFMRLQHRNGYARLNDRAGLWGAVL